MCWAGGGGGGGGPPHPNKKILSHKNDIRQKNEISTPKFNADKYLCMRKLPSLQSCSKFIDQVPLIKNAYFPFF